MSHYNDVLRVQGFKLDAESIAYLSSHMLLPVKAGQPPGSSEESPVQLQCIQVHLEYTISLSTHHVADPAMRLRLAISLYNISIINQNSKPICNSSILLLS